MSPLRLALLLLLALAAPAGAAEPVSPTEFRAYSEGYTLYFSENGEYFGAESYGSDRRALWQYKLGDCVAGVWRPRGGQICFTYEDGEGEICWRLFRDERGLFARLVGDEGEADDILTLRVFRRDREPLRCGGPAV